jgi:membrane protein YqaA with SNARE-associated domain
MTDLWWLAGGYYPLAVMSVLLPWVNGEPVMLSAVPLARTPLSLGALVVVVTAGQMTGKTVMFWIARKAKGPRAARLDAVLQRWRTHLERRPRSAVGVMLLSSLFGLPPFYLVSMAAGALGVGFGHFVVIGFLGRLIHFDTIAFVPHLVWRGL